MTSPIFPTIHEGGTYHTMILGTSGQGKSVLLQAEALRLGITYQIKAFFMMLPADIIGSALSWGFSDTEVRERTYEFVEQNKQAVLQAIKAE